MIKCFMLSNDQIIIGVSNGEMYNDMVTLKNAGNVINFVDAHGNELNSIRDFIGHITPSRTVKININQILMTVEPNDKLQTMYNKWKKEIS